MVSRLRLRFTLVRHRCAQASTAVNVRYRLPDVPVPGVTDRARSLALGLYAKAGKQFRSVIILAERGFGGEVTVLTRTLFETTLAMNFIMNETVTLKRDGTPFDPDPSQALTTDFRVLLYGAAAVFKQEKRYKEWNNRPELASCLHLCGDPHKIAAQIAQARIAVGEKWSKVLEKGKGILPVKDLADSLCVLSYYIMMYRYQSEVAHAGDGFMHIDFDDDGGRLDLGPSADGIDGLLQLATPVFLGCLVGIHNRLNFGPEAEAALTAYAKRLGVTGC